MIAKKNKLNFYDVIKDNVLIGSSRSRKLNCLKRGGIVYLGDYRTVKYMSLFMNKNSLKKIESLFNDFYFDNEIIKILDLESKSQKPTCNNSHYNNFVEMLISGSVNDKKIPCSIKSFNPKEFFGGISFKISSSTLSRIFFYNQSANNNIIFHTNTSPYPITMAPFIFVSMFKEINRELKSRKLRLFPRYKFKLMFEHLSNYITLLICLSNYKLAEKILNYKCLKKYNLKLVFGSHIDENLKYFLHNLNNLFVEGKKYLCDGEIKDIISQNDELNVKTENINCFFSTVKFYVSRLLKTLKILKYLKGDNFNLDKLLTINKNYLFGENNQNIIGNYFYRKYFVLCDLKVSNPEMFFYYGNDIENKNYISEVDLRTSIIIYNFLSVLYNFDYNLFCNNPDELVYTKRAIRPSINNSNSLVKCLCLDFDSLKIKEHTRNSLDYYIIGGNSIKTRNKLISNYNYFKPFITIVNSNKILRYNSESMASELELDKNIGLNHKNKNKISNLSYRYFDSVVKHNVSLRDNSDNSIASYNTEDHLKAIIGDYDITEWYALENIETYNTNFVFSIDKSSILKCLINDKISRSKLVKHTNYEKKHNRNATEYSYLNPKLTYSSIFKLEKSIDTIVNECSACFNIYINKMIVESDRLIELLVGTYLIPVYNFILKNDEASDKYEYKNIKELVKKFYELKLEFLDKKQEIIDSDEKSIEEFNKIMDSFEFVKYLVKIFSKLKNMINDSLIILKEEKFKRITEFISKDELIKSDLYLNLDKIIFSDIFELISYNFYQKLRVNSIVKVFLDKRRSYDYDTTLLNNFDLFKTKLLCFEKGASIWNIADYFQFPIGILRYEYFHDFKRPDIIILILRLKIKFLMTIYSILVNPKSIKNEWNSKLTDTFSILEKSRYELCNKIINEKVKNLIRNSLSPFVGIKEKECDYKTVTCQNIKMSLLDNRHNLNIQYRNLYKKFRKVLNSYNFYIKITKRKKK
ncbi:MAG: hypothetical protein QXP60_02330 [Nitrososphaerota archaeon]